MLPAAEIERWGKVTNLCYAPDFLTAPENTDPKALGFDLYGYLYWNAGSGPVPCGFIAREESSGIVGEFFRGTGDEEEWGDDFKFWEEADHWLPGACTHAGFTNLEDTVTFLSPTGQPARDFLGNLVSSGKVRARVSGHSLGAAVGNLTSARIGNGIEALLFAGPAVGCQDYEVLAASRRGNVERIDILSDPILKVPPEFFGYVRPPLTLALDPAGKIRQAGAFPITLDFGQLISHAINGCDHFLDNILFCMNPANPPRPGCAPNP